MTRLVRLFRRRKLNSDLTGEIAAHIEEKADELVESGVSREEALREARRHFGNPLALREESLDVWSFPVVETLLRDLRIGARTLRKNPLFATVCVATLALGIGANVAIFSLISAVLLRPLPFPDANRIMVLWEVQPKQNNTASLGTRHHQNPVSPVNFLEWRDRTQSFSAMAAIFSFPLGLSGFGEPAEVDTLQVSADFFRILGVAPLLGRTFTVREDVPNGPRLVVLSYDLWRSRFGGDRAIMGRTVQLNDEPYKITGVMPENFDLPFRHADIWVPAQVAHGMQSDEGRYMTVIGKLKSGVSAAQAKADLAGVARNIARERPFQSRGWTTNIVSLYEQTTGDVNTALILLFGAVMFVLLIASANVANLLLMRGTERRREIALRAALGASRSRLISQLLAESFLLSIAGGALGIALAIFGVHGIVASLPALALPRIEGVHIDARVLGFSVALCLITALLFGLAPALSFSRTNPNDALKQSSVRTSGPGGRRIRSLLVVFEVALSLVLLAGAALLARSFLNEINVNRGFRIDHILTMRMYFAPARYYNDAQRARYLEDILGRVRALPGVEAASSADMLPMTGGVSGSCFSRKDRPAPTPGMQHSADFVTVSPQYFSVMGIPLLTGRDFNGGDTIGKEPGIIVNESFVRQFFPGERAIGKHLNLCWNIPEGVIIGVVADARQTDLTVTPKPTIFLNQAQSPRYFGALVVRTALPPMTVAHSVEATIHAVDPDQAISHVRSMEQVVSESVARPRLESVLFAIFAGVALLLAVIGLYGVLAYQVTQRTREIGIRMALGANSSQLVRSVVQDGFRLLAAGIAAGVLASIALTRLLESLLYDIKPIDPPTLIAVAACLVIAGLFASWLPARRAAQVDPIESLRWE
ncbi:MAG TPA: ABC transporter permease [Bryobacteraceae bacterium]|nr:ABC transporter permease [Bryobacteraceae bacterium]